VVTALIVGTIVFILIKINGYAYFAKYLNALYQQSHNIWKVSIVRTLIGLILGFGYNAFFYNLLSVNANRAPFGGDDAPLFFGLMVVLRLIEWSIIVFIFYDRKLINKKYFVKAIVLGAIFSFILDIPILFGLISSVSC